MPCSCILKLRGIVFTAVLTIGLALILPVAIFCRGTMQMMRSATVRWVMLSSSINIELMLFAQLYWLKRVFNLEE
jgi:hypothetical protein